MSAVMNVAKGRVASYAALAAAATGAIKVIPLLAAGLEITATISDYVTVAALLAGTNDEQTVMGRKTVTGITVTPDNSGNWNTVDCADVTWTGVTAGSGVVGALLFAYDPTGSSADSALIPLTVNDWSFTPDGGDVTATIAGFFRAS